MRWVCVSLLILSLAGCAVRKPLTREPVVGIYAQSTRAQIMPVLETILSNEKIPVLRIDRQAGTILTDSFSVLPEYCDCGKNFFGAEYPGTRRGQMAISVHDGDRTTVKFKFGTLLNITANNKQVTCTSFGVLEDKLLDQLDTGLSVARANAAN